MIALSFCFVLFVGMKLYNHLTPYVHIHIPTNSGAYYLCGWVPSHISDTQKKESVYFKSLRPKEYAALTGKSASAGHGHH